MDVGFTRSVYTASEPDMSASVCVEVKQGTLGIPVNFSLTTHDESAQGTHVHIYPHVNKAYDSQYMGCTYLHVHIR